MSDETATQLAVEIIQLSEPLGDNLGGARLDFNPVYRYWSATVAVKPARQRDRFHTVTASSPEAALRLLRNDLRTWGRRRPA